SYIVDDAQLALVLTHSSLEELLSPLAKMASFVVLNREEGIVEPSMVAPQDMLDLRQSAYSIYTSGSTGRPKGVLVEHQQLAQYIEAVIERLELTAGIRAGLLQSLTADFGVTMLYPTLALGGVLHLVSQQCASDPQALGLYMQRQAIE